MPNQKERLKKLYELALNGIDGEKENAKLILDRLLKKYNISIDELDEETVNDYKIEYHGKEQGRLLSQTVYKVTGECGNCSALRYTRSGRPCNVQLSVRCTAAQKVEIEFLFNFYTILWEKEREAFFTAFIQKHRIFGELKDGEEGVKLSDEEVKKLLAYMNGMSDETPLKQIEG